MHAASSPRSIATHRSPTRAFSDRLEETIARYHTNAVTTAEVTPHRKLALSGLRDRALLGVLVYNGTVGWIVTRGSVPVGLTPLWRALAARASSPSRDP